VERRRTQRGGGLERHVGVVLVVTSLRHRSVVITAAADGSAQQESGLELAARPAREDQRMVRPRVVPRRTGTSESQKVVPRQADPPEAVGGAASSRLSTFRWF
jgi:hypothetical protein